MKTLLLIAFGLSTSVAMAEFEKHSPTQIDFNKMIELNNQQVREKKKEISQNGFGARPSNQRDDSKVVTDFLDVEVGWGEAPQVVDRRYN